MKKLNKKAAMKYSIIIALIIANAIVFALILIPSITAIPKDFSINGKLTDDSGSVLTGNYNVTFRIYKNESGGSALWIDANQSITSDSNGVFTARLRNFNLNFSEQYYLSLEINADGEMSPRINLSSSPYAFRAQNITIQGVEFTSNVDLGNNNLTVNGSTLFVNANTGRVGIGTNPNVKLNAMEARQ